jgi:hypothetical protein
VKYYARYFSLQEAGYCIIRPEKSGKPDPYQAAYLPDEFSSHKCLAGYRNQLKALG